MWYQKLAAFLLKICVGFFTAFTFFLLFPFLVLSLVVSFTYENLFSSFFYHRMTVHRNRFLVNKTNRRTEIQFYWYYDCTWFGQCFCPSSGVLSRTSALVHFMQLWWPSSTRCRMDLRCSSILLLAKNSWWWAERLPETCRVAIPIKLDFIASVGFIHKEFVLISFLLSSVSLVLVLSIVPSFILVFMCACVKFWLLSRYISFYGFSFMSPSPSVAHVSFYHGLSNLSPIVNISMLRSQVQPSNINKPYPDNKNQQDVLFTFNLFQ